MLKTSDIKSTAQILRDMKYPPVKEDTDKDEPGTQGDKEEYQRKRKEIAKKFGVESCSALKDEEKRKACYAALDAAHVSDDEEDEDDDPVGKNEEVEIDEASKKEHDKLKKEIQKLLKRHMWDIPDKELRHIGKLIKKRDELARQLGIATGIIKYEEVEEDVDVTESFSLQATMALGDAGIMSRWKKGKLYVARKDIKKAEKALAKSFKHMKKGAEPDLWHEEVELDEADKKYPPTIETLKMIVKDKQNQVVKFKDGNARVDGYSASAMTQVYDAMKKPDLKKKFEDQLKTKAGFLKIQAFAFSMVK